MRQEQVERSNNGILSGFTIALTIAAIGVNLGLNAVNNALSLPFFFDSIGTAVVAATVGLAPGLAVAVGTNFAIEVLNGFPWTHLPFAVCGVATAMVVWLFARTGRFEMVGDALFASLLVVVANSVLGALIATFVYGGLTAVGVDYVVTALVATGRSILSAAFWARVPANLVDKTIAVMVAFLLCAPLGRFLRLPAAERERPR